MAKHGPSTLERYAYALLALVAAICGCCGLAGCKTSDPDVTPVPARWAQICMRNDLPDTRTSDESCDTAPNRFHWLYVFQDDPGYAGCPPVGGQLKIKNPDDGWITSRTRPVDGTVGRVPYNGGLGVVLEEVK